MKKIGLSLIVFSALLSAVEIEYGSGTFNMNGGFLGLTGSIGTDIDTFSLVERHSNIAGSDIFYSYDLTWLDSRTLKQAQHTYNNMTTVANNFLPTTQKWKIPSMEYRVKGMDVNIRAGYDVIHENEDNFLGIGLATGLSMPWIDSSSSATPDSSSIRFILENKDTALTAADYFKKSKTSIMTYKIGPTVNFQKSFNKNVSIYGMGTIAYQTGYIENDYISSKMSVDGTFQEYNVGLYFTPFTETYKWGWLTLSPRLYGTIGYKYSKWDVDEVLINISGAEMSSKILDPLSMKFGFDSSVGYAGVGYSF